jgi:hypothetical protein
VVYEGAKHDSETRTEKKQNVLHILNHHHHPLKFHHDSLTTETLILLKQDVKENKENYEQ